MQKQKQKTKVRFLLSLAAVTSVALFIGLALFRHASVTAATGTNEQLNYQARLLNSQGAVVPDGLYNIRFRIYQDGDGVLGGGDETLEWTEARTGASRVTVKNGYFSVYLGSVTPFSGSVDWNQDTLWLSVDIGGTGGSPSYDGEMSPFTRLSSSPYALNSAALGGLTRDNFVQLGQGVQTDASANASIHINDTGGGNFLHLLSGSVDRFTVSNTGTIAAATAADTINGIIINAGAISGVAGFTQNSGNFDASASSGTFATSTGAVSLNGNTTVAGSSTFAVGSGLTTLSGGLTATGSISLNTTGSANTSIGNATGTFALTSSGVNITTGGAVSGATTIAASGLVSGGSLSAANGLDLVCGGNERLQSANVADGIMLGGTCQGGISDQALKQNVASLNNNVLDKIKDVNAVSFDYDCTNSIFQQNGGKYWCDPETSTGVVAQELALVFPELVYQGGDGYYRVKYEQLGIYTLKAVQELAGIVDSSGDAVLNSLTVNGQLLVTSGGALQNLTGLSVSSGGASITGGLAVDTISGNGASLTNLNASNISSGTLGDSSLSSNVALLDAGQTFTALTAFGGGLSVGNTANTTAGNIRWTGTDFEGYDGSEWVSLTTPSSELAAATFYDAAGTDTFASGTYSTLNLDTTLENSNPTALSLSNDTVTINQDGLYQISYELSASLGSGTRSGFLAKIQRDTGGGFTDVNGSFGSHYGRTAGDPTGTSSATVVLNLSAGDVIRVQGQGTAASFQAVAGGSRLTIVRIVQGLASGGGGGGGSSFEQGGNNFGGTALIGTTDNFGFNFITNTVTQLSLDTSGNINLVNGSLQTGGTTRLSNTGVLQNITGLTVASGGANISGGLTVASGGASITGGLNNNSNGITNTGSVAGVTTLGLSGALTSSGNISTSGNIFTTGSGTITSVGTLTASSGLIITTGGSTISAGNLSLATGSLLTNSVTRLTNAGALQNITGLTITSGGANITGGLNNNSGGITNAGAISGATTVTASGSINTTGGNILTNNVVRLSTAGALQNITGLTVTASGIDNGNFGITNTGAIAGATSITASGNINTTGVYQKNGVSGLSLTCTGNTRLGAPTISGGIVTAGDCQSGGLSDARLKNNVVSLGDDILNKIRDINTVNFDFVCDHEFFSDNSRSCDPKNQTGVIAQQLAEVFPELVYQEDDGYYRVNYEALNIYTLKAVTELAQAINIENNRIVFNTASRTGLTILGDNGAELFAIDDQGNATFNGTITAENSVNQTQVLAAIDQQLANAFGGGLEISGYSVFNAEVDFREVVNFANDVVLAQDVIFQGRPIFNNDTAGFASIKQTDQEVRVEFANEFVDVPVVNVSNIDGQFINYTYKDLDETGFTIVMQLPATQDTEFSWTAFAVDNALTWASDDPNQP